MNILLTSAGRRSYMADYFRKALNGKGLVYAANSQMSPALQNSDGFFLTPIIYSSDYIPFLLKKCEELKISLIVSLFDIDLPVLAAHRDEFAKAGTRLAVSSAEFLGICSDKYRMGTALETEGIRSPETYLSEKAALEALDRGELSWPLLVKPRFGMGSIGVLKAWDETELAGAYSMCRRETAESYLKYESAAAPDETVLIQELISGEEYGLDIISDLDGNYVNTIIRRKYAMRSGETDEAIILGPDAPVYESLMQTAERLAQAFRPAGLIDVDVIADPLKGAPAVIDINARFGGGYPFSQIAGADVPKAYILWMEGKNEEARKYCSAQFGVHGFKEITPKVMNSNV